MSVIKFHPKDAAKSADAVLEQSIGQFSDVLVIGYDAEGNLDARATLGLTDQEAVYLVEMFKAFLFQAAMGLDE